MPIQKRHAAESVLRALLQGREVRLGAHRYALSEDDCLCTLDGSNNLYITELTFDRFMKMCSEMPESELVGLQMDLALQSAHDARRRHRG